MSFGRPTYSTRHMDGPNQGLCYPPLASVGFPSFIGYPEFLSATRFAVSLQGYYQAPWPFFSPEALEGTCLCSGFFVCLRGHCSETGVVRIGGEFGAKAYLAFASTGRYTVYVRFQGT